MQLKTMNKLILITIIIFISACSNLQKNEKESDIVYVDVPVVSCPNPPDIPLFESEVDKLSEADINDPGKVGVAYKRDMLMLRHLYKTHVEILNKYRDLNTEIKEK